MNPGGVRGDGQIMTSRRGERWSWEAEGSERKVEAGKRKKRRTDGPRFGEEIVIVRREAGRW